MSDIMTCMPFGQLMDWVLQEKKAGRLYWVHRPYTADPKNDMTIFTRNLETPVGPAAVPTPSLHRISSLLIMQEPVSLN